MNWEGEGEIIRKETQTEVTQNIDRGNWGNWLSSKELLEACMHRGFLPLILPMSHDWVHGTVGAFAWVIIITVSYSVKSLARPRNRAGDFCAWPP